MVAVQSHDEPADCPLRAVRAEYGFTHGGSEDWFSLLRLVEGSPLLQVEKTQYEPLRDKVLFLHRWQLIHSPRSRCSHR